LVRIISSIVALSFCPMLASRMLAHGDAHEGHGGAVGSAGRFFAALYRRTLKAALNAPLIIVTVALLFAALAAALFGTIRSELTPSEDRSAAFIRITAPQGVSVDYLAQNIREIERLIQPLRDSGEVVNTFASAGSWGSRNNGFIVLTLAPRDQRERTQQQIVEHDDLFAMRGPAAMGARILADAARAWRQLPCPYQELLTTERHARHLLVAGRQERALDVLTTAQHRLQALGARWDADRVAQLLRQHGVEVTRAWRGGRRGYGDQLSPRELEVVRLVARGMTNRQVAEALFLSPRTVDRHLSAAMRKLEVRSRTALAMAAHDGGLLTG
jgi:DNA-binding NarL/FixJ family response regulator